MNLNELMNDIHANAVVHGWWENPRSDAEVRVLIHSELSESLEEDRAGRPGVWYMCNHDEEICSDNCDHYVDGVCDVCDRRDKPEGWAVELIDACIRILDYLGHQKYQFGSDVTVDTLVGCYAMPAMDKWSLCELLDDLHWHISRSRESKSSEHTYLTHVLGYTFSWLKAKGFAPEHLLLEKHEYNKTRPYKHGKKY